MGALFYKKSFSWNGEANVFVKSLEVVLRRGTNGFVMPGGRNFTNAFFYSLNTVNLKRFTKYAGMSTCR